MTIQPAAVAYTGSLVWRFPDLLEPFGEHLADNDGEVLPHVFMAVVERWAESLLAERPEELTELLAELDHALDAGQEAVANLIDVSFVENLPYPDEPNAEIRNLLPVRLKGLLRHGL
jgi:hypothetical protein